MKKILNLNCSLEQAKNMAEKMCFDFGGVHYKLKKVKNAEQYSYIPTMAPSFFRNSFAPAFILKFAEFNNRGTLVEITYYTPLPQRILLWLMTIFAISLQIMLFFFKSAVLFILPQDITCYFPAIILFLLFLVFYAGKAISTYFLCKKIKLIFSKCY